MITFKDFFEQELFDDIVGQNSQMLKGVVGEQVSFFLVRVFSESEQFCMKVVCDST